MKEVAHLGVLGIHVELILLVGGNLYRLATDNFQAEAVDAAYLLRIVGHQTQLMDAKVGKDAGTRAVFAQVGGKAKGYVGFYGVHTLILQVVGAELVDESDATAFLTKVEEHSPALLLYATQSLGKLFATVAAQGTEGIAGEALGVNTTENWLGGGDIALDESDMVLARHLINISVGTERAVFGGERSTGYLFDEFLRAAAVFDE